MLRALFYVEQNYCFAILRPLQAEILGRGGEVRWFFVGDEVDSGYLSASEIALSSVTKIRQWQPHVVFVPGDTVPRAIPGLKVEVFHGFAAGKSYGRGRDAHFAIRDCFDLYCTHGPSNTEQFQQLAEEHGHFQVVETGWPMVDALFTPQVRNPYVDSVDTRPTVLFCSTFSRRYSCAETLYDTVCELKARDRFRWLVQFHPKMSVETINKYREISDENLQFIETDNVIPLLQAADIMLCDTSSILMMFLLLHRPVVAFRNQNPGPHLINISDPAELEQALENGLSEDSQRDAAIEQYARQIHPYRDGLSSGRIVDAVQQIIEEGLQVRRSKPLNLVRELKMRRKLKFWWP
ncbi:CDP-glycerol glycerophosphotransferase family protein [Congregibacter sp.]|uniref:CDP-glycerol glycerophosphotransferase family protein n=1 Tax=Congregibacter sp. TaxID=2744308 RepID=UPI003F6BA274